MARNAAKSKALQPRSGIQSRLEKQKAKAKGLEPELQTEEADKKEESAALEHTEDTQTTEAPLVDNASLEAEPSDSPAARKGTRTRTPAMSAAAPAPKRTGKRGRPRSEISRTALTVRPKDETVKRLREYAAENGYGISDVVDVLVEMYLDNDRVAKHLVKMKGQKQS